MVLVWAVSVVFLKEKFGLVQLSGSVLVLLGLYLTSLSQSQVKGFRVFNQDFLYQQRWSFLCAVFIACYHICYGHSLREGSRPATLFAVSLWLSVFLIFTLRGRTYFESAKAMAKIEWRDLLISGFVCNLSFLFFLVGLAQTGAGTAITLRNTSVIFAQILAVFLGEKIKAPQWIGALMVAAGASLVAMD
jgi:drug/metabolite transporter (DMT)-like permease